MYSQCQIPFKYALSAILSDLDGWMVFDSGCSGCWSLRRRIASFKREDTEACNFLQPFCEVWQFDHRWLITRKLRGRYVHLLTVLGSCVLMTPAIECRSMVAIDTSIDPRSTCLSPLGRHIDRYMIDTRPTTGDSRSSVDRIMCRAIVCC